MREIVISSWSDFIDLIVGISSKAGRRLWYRGQSDSSWDLLPNVKRSPYNQKGYEQFLVTDFYIEAMRRREKIPQNQAGQLALMQHYGLPTRLLDWSESPLVALYFATRSWEQHPQANSVIWAMNPQKLNQLQGFDNYLPPFDVDHAFVVELIEGAFNFKKQTGRILACCNVENDLRMYVQQANFTIHDADVPMNQMDNSDLFLTKIIIPCSVRNQFAIQLKFLGFRKSTIFPDIEHIAEELREDFT